MKIAVAGVITKKITSHPLGGTEAFTYLLVNGLVKKGHEVTLYCAKGSETDANQVEICEAEEAMGEQSNVEFVYPYTLLEVKRIIEDIQKEKFDLLHVNFLKTFMLSFFADQIKIPIIYTMHRNFFNSQKFLDVYEKIGFHSNESYVFVSQNAQGKSLLKNNTYVIYNGIDINGYSYSDKKTDEFFWLSRIDPLKGPKEAILASQVAKEKIRLVGDIDRKKYQEYFDTELKPLFSKDIVYEKPTTFERKVELYQNAKAFIFPIQWEEPFGLVMAEAMSCGTPVIAYNRGSVSELVRDGVTGFVIDPDDQDRPNKGSWIIKKQGVEGLKEAMQRIGEIDPKNCRKHIEENFTVEKMVENYGRLYREIIGKNKEI